MKIAENCEKIPQIFHSFFKIFFEIFSAIFFWNFSSIFPQFFPEFPEFFPEFFPIFFFQFFHQIFKVSWDTLEMILTSSCGWSGSLRVNIPMKSGNRTILPNVENSGLIRKERRLCWIVWCTSCHITDLGTWSLIIAHRQAMTELEMQWLEIKIFH